MKKLILFIVIAIMFSIISLAAHDSEIKSINFNGYIIGDNVRIRESYSIESKVVGFLKMGTAVKCEFVTKITYQIGSDSDYWCKCSPKTFGPSGWVYGKYISKEKFDQSKYINSLPLIEYSSKIYDSLIDTGWSSCDPKEPNDCDSIYFNSKIIRSGGMEGVYTYLIESITENINTITINAKLIMSNMPITNDPNQKIKYTIQSIDNRKIIINGIIHYKL